MEKNGLCHKEIILSLTGPCGDELSKQLNGPQPINKNTRFTVLVTFSNGCSLRVEWYSFYNHQKLFYHPGNLYI